MWPGFFFGSLGGSGDSVVLIMALTDKYCYLLFKPVTILDIVVQDSENRPFLIC